MRITRNVQRVADESAHRDQDTESPGIVRLGTIAEMVHGPYYPHLDSGGSGHYR